MTTNKEECSCRKKLVLPPILPWESGSNKFASQKGESAFGATRNNVLNLEPPKADPTPPAVVDNRPIPTFGGHRPQITNSVFKDEKSSTTRHNFTPNTSSNPPVKAVRTQNLEIQSSRLRKISEEEEFKCKAAIPRFVSPSGSISQKHEEELKENKSRKHRSTWYGDYSVIDSKERQRYLAWIGGQLTTVRPIGQSQSPESPKSQTFYEKLMFERKQQIRPEVLQARLEAYANASNSSKP